MDGLDRDREVYLRNNPLQGLPDDDGANEWPPNHNINGVAPPSYPRRPSIIQVGKGIIEIAVITGELVYQQLPPASHLITEKKYQVIGCALAIAFSLM